MRLSRILTLVAALALPTLPAAAQGKGVGKPAGVGKPTIAGVKAPKAPNSTGSTTHGKSADHAKTTTATATEDSSSKGRGQLPLGEKIALNGTLKARLDALLVGSTLTYDQATTGWKNQGQLVAAMNAAKNNNLSFASIYTEMVTNGKKLPDAVAFVQSATPPPTTTTATTTAATTP